MAKRSGSVPRKPRNPADAPSPRWEVGLGAFAAASVDAFMLFDENLNVVGVNPAAERLAEPSRPSTGAPIGKSILDLSPEIKDSLRYDEYLRVLETGEPYYAEVVSHHPELGEKHHSIKAFRVGDGLGLIVSDITEHRQVEEALHASEEKYRGMFESMLDGFAYHEIVLDEDGKPVDYVFLELNNRFEEYTGLKRDDIIGRRVTEVVPGIRNADPDLIGIYGKVALTGEPVQFNVYFAPFDKHYSISAYCPREGYFVALFQDVTDRKRAEEALHGSERKYRTLFETMAQGVVYQDANGEITSANRAAERILGLTLDQMQGRTSTDPRWQAIHEDGSDFPGETHPAMVALQTGKPVTDVVMGVFNPQTNEHRWTIIDAVPQFRPGEDQPCQAYTTFEDVTERRQAEDVVRAQRDLGAALSAAVGLDEGLRLCLDAALNASGMDSGGIYLVDDATGALDLAIHQGLPSDFVQAVSHFDADSERARLVRDGNPVYAIFPDLEVALDDAETRERLRSIAIIPIHHENRVIGCLNAASHSLEEVPHLARIALELIATQIGSSIARLKAEEALQHHSEQLEILVDQRTKELRAAQEQLLLKEKLATLGQLAGGVGHELRNPLGAIKNAAYYLNMVLEHPDRDVKDTLDILDREVATSERIISSLFDFGREKPPSQAKVDLNEVIQAVLSRFDIPGNVEVASQLGEGLPVILADPGQLNQVFGNIILNAVQAMPEGGRLHIESEESGPGWVAVSFTDTGAGMTAETLLRIFEPLFTTKAKGIGLGLAHSRTLVEGHGGTIDIQSELGRGSTFTVRVPTSRRIATGGVEGGRPERNDARVDR